MSKFKCSHCKLSFDDSAAILTSQGQKFCCNGCKNVYEILHSSGLDEFYDRLGKNTLSPVCDTQNLNKNLQSIYQNYVKNDNGFNKINLIIDGIHCSACIWLNEKVLFNTHGVLEANINATNNKATIVWDESQVGLGEILMRINAIGYNAYPYDAGREETRLEAKRREFYTKLLVGVFATMNIMWIAIAQWAGYFTGIRSDIKDILSFAEFLLATPVLFYTGSAFFSGAKIAIKNRLPNMDLLIATGASMAYLYSVYAMFSRHGECYFDSVAMIITFVFIGKFLEILSCKRASDTIDELSQIVLSEVDVLVDGAIVPISIHDVKVDDTIVLRSGQKALIDGVIISGEASFDLSSLTGESLPLNLCVGEAIKSGAICLNGRVEYKASASFENSFLNKIINLLENASLKKPSIELLANKISSKFSLIVISIAVVVFAFWYINYGFEKALIVAISIIVIACPCALGLATPVSTLIALDVGLKRGVIFKEAKVIESLAKCDVVVFDKTGTLTTGRLSVDRFINLKDTDISLIYTLASSSKHPVSVAVAKYLDQNVSSLANLQNVQEIAAKGVVAEFDGVSVCGGGAVLMRELGIDVGQSQTSSYYVAIGGELVAKFELSDRLRDDAVECVRDLVRSGMSVYMLTGDNENIARSVADELGITHFKALCLPDDKANFVQELQSSGKNVMMVGDGINDALVLSYASVAICMGSGADVSLERSDVVVLNDSLSDLLNAVKTARQTLQTIKQNLTFSLCYNALTIPIAAMGYIIPLFAALSMSFSSIIVVLNSLRIRNLKDMRG
ncbi:cadmium-translocating P-type ATPase [Campylobacter sp. faydin G-140]|uniref:heavy metal translocating P-type ATPase n=1 Tax=Campylobacter anatolicus TaxID=2829105 RepID=UPI001B9CA0F7|nr:heavy metal translocating P-type ATPase [Campylobacter anatolicus]MBR8464837.1 cadmium-translocating P-type ATPase [Campylobacter anatolicus]